jgi:acyl-CoA synthetase (AMP-forming)/AMP-acid ligase II
VSGERVTTARDTGGWLVLRNPYLEQWAEREGLWPGKTVAQFAYERATADPDRTMIIDNDRHLGAGKLYRDATALAGHLQNIGVSPGDVISFQLPNWWEATVVNLAAALIGAVVNPILPINREAEVAFILKDTRSKAIFIPAGYRRHDYASMMDKLTSNGEFEGEIIEVRGKGQHFRSFDEVIGTSPTVDIPAATDPNAVKLIMYTSGTTGRPKGVLHSHNSINADSIKMRAAIGLSSEDMSFIPSPVTHVTGYLWVLNVPWCCDVPAATIDTWIPELAFDTLERERCAFAAGATPFLRDLVAVAGTRGRTLPHLRNYLCGGASVPPELIYSAAELFPNCVPWRNYGSTEAPTLTRCPESRRELRLGAETDGRIYQADFILRDPQSGAVVAEGEQGEIYVREPSMALGYVHFEDNEHAYDGHGFFRMGDVGRIIENDHILITDRLKDIIIRSGENLSSKEIEDALLSSPLILDAAVVGVPNERTGEAVFAFLVVGSGAAVTIDQLIKIIECRGLARQKSPEFFELVSELPRTASGKVLKHKLRDLARSASVRSGPPDRGAAGAQQRLDGVDANGE